MVGSYNQGGPINSSSDDSLEYRPPSEMWFGGVEATFMHTVRQGAPSVDIHALENFNEGDPDSNDADSQYGIAPRIWLGLELNDCWGVRGRFWQLKDNNSALSGDPGPSFDGAGPGGNFSLANYDLDAYNIDLEATRNWCMGEWSGDVSLGGCYASLRRDDFASLYFLDTGTTAFGQLPPANGRRRRHQLAGAPPLPGRQWLESVWQHARFRAVWHDDCLGHRGRQPGRG